MLEAYRPRLALVDIDKNERNTKFFFCQKKKFVRFFSNIIDGLGCFLSQSYFLIINNISGKLKTSGWK